MAHSKQAFKRARQSEAKRVVNKNVRTRMKSSIKRALGAAEAEQPAALSDAWEATKNSSCRRWCATSVSTC